MMVLIFGNTQNHIMINPINANLTGIFDRKLRLTITTNRINKF
jgi:hypothetical protein